MPPRAPARARPAPGARPGTVDRVLDAAERLAQTRGFNGFSYADVAEELGVTTAALHYHFPGKAELGRALVERYASRFLDALAAIAAREPRARPRLDAYAGLYGDVAASGRMCLCGMLAAEYETLPAVVQRAIRAFFDGNEAWLARVLESGRDEGDLAFSGPARDVARWWTSALEGSMLLARPFGEASRVTGVARRMLEEIAAAARPPRRPTAARSSRTPRA